MGDQGGSTINISSVASTTTLPNMSVYSATKAAVDAITKSFSKELGVRKIRVNAINPGFVETEGVHAAGFDSGEMRSKTRRRHRLAGWGSPMILPRQLYS